ncbi:MAG: hypothetical protein P4L67_01180 [Candidatus Pacebacteria bacterium]|nr:hypothetical protein [Candidatus Paceibacterota bacterium]
MKKKHIYAAVAIVVAVILIVIVGDMGFGKKTAKAPTEPDMAVSTNTAASGTGSSTVSVVLSTSTPKSYAGASFSFTYPGPWSIFSARPLVITNFNGQYRDKGVIPAGGAQITVVTTTSGGPVADIITTELMHATNITASGVVVDGTTCKKEVFRADYTPGATSQDTSIYCLRGSELWKIYLSYPANDAASAAHISDFNGVLDSMKFK